MSKAGYVYILQNNSHDNLVLKIGRTINEPEVRAKQLYRGATGVPEHFDVVEAYSVGDCVEAENTIHERLATYRVNPKREFFKIEPSVAQAIAMDTCTKVNSSMGLASPAVLKFKSEKAKSYIKPIPDTPADQKYSSITTLAELSEAKIAPVGITTLTDEQVDRINIVSLILAEVELSSSSDWAETFSRDKYPEREIVVWENIAKVYQNFDGEESRSKVERQSAYDFILASSALDGEDLRNAIASCPLSYETIMSIVQSMKK